MSSDHDGDTAPGARRDGDDRRRRAARGVRGRVQQRHRARAGRRSPRRGGTLRVGALGKRSAIERDPHKVQPNESDYLIACLVYEALTVPGREPVTARG